MAELKHRQPGVQIDVDIDDYRSTSQSSSFSGSPGGSGISDFTEASTSQNYSSRNNTEGNESVDVLREQLRTMKEMIKEYHTETANQELNKPRRNKDSPIDGSFLSVVFGVVLTMILSVSFYAFQNLYYAILKKFPGNSTP